MKRAIFIGVFCVLFSQVCHGQWLYLKTFNKPIGTIEFLNSEYPPKLGFVGTSYASGPYSEVWKTTDGGLNWEQSGVNKPINEITSFAIKDKNTAWMSCGFLGSNNGGCYKTTDGGLSWNHLTNTFGKCVSVHYINNRLYLVRWNAPSIVSDDEGLNWFPIPNLTDDNYGLAFSNSLQGIIAGGGMDPNLDEMYTTSDGGITWQGNGFTTEAWQPLGIQGTSIFFIASEVDDNIYRSDDGGRTWIMLSNQLNTGHIAGNLDGLYLQVLDSQYPRMVKSTDGGVTWKSICGPGDKYPDTRFYVNNNHIYAGDSYRPNQLQEFGRLWVNTTGNGSGERLLLSHTSGNRDFVLTAGDTWKTDIVLPDTFSTIQWLKLDSLVFTIKYEADVLSLKSAEAASGWKLVSATESLGKVSVKLLRESSNDRGVPVASLIFQANVAREVESDVYIDSVFYNAGEFTNCEVLASEKLHVTISDECGDSTIRKFINSKPILEIVSIHPNPTNGDITIDFRTLVDGDVSLEVFDNNVRGLIREVIPVKAGVTSKTLDLSQFFGGAFFVQLTLGKDVATGKFVKQ